MVINLFTNTNEHLIIEFLQQEVANKKKNFIEIELEDIKKFFK
jgi:hypothetical protein